MPKTHHGSIEFTTNFNVQTTRPLDDRLVVDSIDDLRNGSIKAPYLGMVVTIARTSELYVLTSEPEYANDLNNWKLVTGSGSGTSEDVEERIQEIRESLGILTDIVGEPGENPTGIFEEIENLKKSNTGVGKYSLPVMTPEMVTAATEDDDIDFDGSEDPHILVEYDPLSVTQAQSDVYMGLIYDMTKAIKALQAEVARLKNSFEYGIDSYKNTRTAKSVILGEMDVEAEEPLWSLDPEVGLSLVPDSSTFNTLLDINHKFEIIGTGTIDTSIDEQLTFNDCKGVFYDGNSSNASDDNLTLYKLTDSKLITYLVTDKPDIKMTLVSMDDKNQTREIEFAPLMNGNTVNKYGFCVVISRKQKVNETEKGFNYIYFSIINYENDKKLYEGYLTDGGWLVDTRVDVSQRYSIKSIEFDRLTLSRMKFYTKFEDFSDEVIPSVPSEDDWKYEVAHIAIRSVKDTEMLNAVAGQLKDNELIWNKKSGTLHIKSDGKICTIGSKSTPDEDEHNKDNNMTDREIIAALEKMGIVVNVNYKKDAETGEETDEIASLDNLSLASIADVTFINQDTNKKFTFTVDPEGNLVGKDKSAQTIDEYLGSAANGYKTPSDNYKAVRGFSADYLVRKGGSTNVTSDLNAQSDLGKKSDRLRISAFYAPIVSDERHGCTHSFIELENSSPVDIPLTGVYLHFFNPGDNTYRKDGTTIVINEPITVHHLALDGVIKAGGTYLIRGAKHAEFDDESAFIKVRTYDKEWYENGELISFEQKPGNVSWEQGDDTTVPFAYRFCLTYGLADLDAKKQLVQINGDDGFTIGSITYDAKDYPNVILDPRFIDSCSFSTDGDVSKQYGTDNPWYAKGDKSGIGITIKPNSMFRLMFALDPAKQAFNGFNAKDSSRIRYNKATDIQILNLDKEFIGFPHSNETIKIDRYTPKASFENKNVMTDKSQLNTEKPNMVTCSFGVDVYNTRCFNWISCGTFDEKVWLRKQGDTKWIGFESYKKVSSDTTEKVTTIHRKEYSKLVNNTVYARMINRFPGNDVLFTSHKCVVVLPDSSSTPEVYEYVVGRPDKDGNPDFEHTNEIYTFTVYPRSYDGRVYQVTDQQGFHWIEYQVWAASAEYLNEKIKIDCDEINNAIDLYNQEAEAWNQEAEAYNAQAVEYNTQHASEIDASIIEPMEIRELKELKTSGKVFPILINTGDMTQSGARINEWLDYYNGGVSLFNHLEQMNCVGNNDLCPINPRDLGTGNDNDKSSSHFFHYFYCFDVKDTEEYESNTVGEDDKKFFSGETLVVKPHTGTAKNKDKVDTINVEEDKYIPSFYYFKTTNVLYVIVNSEIPESNVQKWFGLCSNYGEDSQYVNIYTGIESVKNGRYAMKSTNNLNGIDYFTPLYETMYAWLKNNDNKTTDKRKVIVAMHEMPFTVITNTSLTNTNEAQIPFTRNYPTDNNGKKSRLGSNVNQLNINENRGIYWCSRLLEDFNCKLVIGGHKHTYALTYPIKEKYNWTYNDVTKDSKNERKPMFATLEDEAGTSPLYNISWDIDLTSDTVRNEYKITTNRTGTNSVSNDATLNSTKAPYIPENLYNQYGLSVYNSTTGLFRCCTPIPVSDDKYDHFVSYSMCQATGYKLKSNKELPSPSQLFSKLIPKTKAGEKPSNEQLYPMYSVLAFNDDYSELDVTMNRITGILLSPGSDSFSQNVCGTGDMGEQTLCTSTDIYGSWKNDIDEDNKYLHIKF